MSATQQDVEIVSYVLPSLLTFFTGGGLVGWVQLQRSKKAAVASDQRQAALDRKQDEATTIDRLERRLADQDRLIEREHKQHLEALNVMRQDVATVRAENQSLEAENRAVLDYAHQLRADIQNGVAPPPREWPKGLRV